MPDRQLLALLDACKQDPDDEAARSVLADFLEEHGDEAARERAAFLRLELASGPERGRPEFRARLGRTWEENERAWAPYQPDLYRSGHAHPDRGLVAATATANGMAGLGRRWVGTEAYAWVRRLTLGPKPAEAAAVMASPLLQGVPELDLNGDATAKLGHHPSLPGLRALSLCYRDRGAAALAALLRSPALAALRRLDLNRCPPPLLDALGAPAALPGLEHLGLAHDLGPATAGAVARPLRSLALGGTMEDGALAAFLRPGPRRLSVDSQAFDAAGVAALGAMLDGLEELNLLHCLFAAPFAPAAGLAGLRVLRLRGMTLEAAGLLRAPGLGGLVYLDLGADRWADPSLLTALPAAPLACGLSEYHLGDRGLAALARWPGFSRCRVLDLNNNGVTAAGIAALANSPHAAGLCGLRLTSNPIGDAGVEALAASPVAAGLEELALEDTGSGERGARAVLASKGLTRVRELTLGPGLPRPLVKALKERFGPALC